MKPPNGLAVRMVFVVCCNIAVAWNVLCDGIFIDKFSVV